MENFITAGSEYNGEESLEVIIRPALANKLPEDLRIIETDGAGSVKKTYLGPASHNVVAYSDGFQGGKSSSRIQKIFKLGEMKAENEWSKQDYKDLVQRQMLDMKKSFQNDFFESELYERLPAPIQSLVTGMEEEDALLNVALWKLEQSGIAEGIFNVFWLGDENKITYDSGIFPNKVVYAKNAADIRFNAANGAWKSLEATASLTPAINQVKRINAAKLGVAQIDTVTLSGTSGTATVTARGLAKIATFVTDLTTTASNFVASFAADYLLVGIIATSSGAGLIFTDAKNGVGFEAVTIAIASGNLDGSRAATEANVVAGPLATDDGINTLKAMYDGSSTVMKEEDDSLKTFYVTNSIWENYRNSQESLTSLESSRSTQIKGNFIPEYRGIQIKKMPIASAISAYFGGYAPHRAILTVKDNLSLVVSSAGKFGESVRWWNKDENKVRARTQFEMGGDYFMPELIVISY